MKVHGVTAALWFAVFLLAGANVLWAQSQGVETHPASPHDGSAHDSSAHDGMAMPGMPHEHAAGAAVSYAELKETVTELETARRGTEKYKDVRVAEADGYRAYGPDVPGMGIHYVQEHGKNEFSLDQPAILLYEKDASVPGGLALVGVSYLLVAPASGDGQPLTSPFPKALAKWHRHENICVLADRSTPPGLSEGQCAARGGHFTPETQWMVHAWIWKDSPLGVFSPTNPNVR
jgi:hypothetical protein